MKKHSWTKVSFFKMICKKCGCTKEKSAVRYPCSIIYNIDGSERKWAGYCDERFVPTAIFDNKEVQLELFEIN